MIFNLPHTSFTYLQITSLLFSVSPLPEEVFHLCTRLLHRSHILKLDSLDSNVSSPWETTPEMGDKTQPQGISQATETRFFSTHLGKIL